MSEIIRQQPIFFSKALNYIPTKIEAVWIKGWNIETDSCKSIQRPEL